MKWYLSLAKCKWAMARMFVPLAMLCIANTAKAQSQALDLSVAVVTPTTLVKRADLDFGLIVPGANGGRVTMNVNGSRTANGTIILVGTDFHVARFAGQGSINQRVQIRLPNNINLTGPGPAMLLNNFRFGPDPELPLTFNQAGNGRNVRITGAAGVFGFVVGADLQVGANQPTGVYTGTFDVTINYQ